MNINNALENLGFVVQDKVTGLKGVVTSISLDLYGCVQYLVTPQVNKENKKEDSWWCDEKRIKMVSKKPVMEQPDFEYIPGPANKPIF